MAKSDVRGGAGQRRNQDGSGHPEKREGDVTTGADRGLHARARPRSGRREPMVMFPRVLQLDKRISDHGKLLYLAMLRQAHGTGKTWCGEEVLADDLGWSVRTVEKHMAALKRLGLVRVRRRHSGACLNYVSPQEEWNGTFETYDVIAVSMAEDVAYEAATPLAEPSPSTWEVAVQYDIAVLQAAETIAHRLSREGRIPTATREEYDRAVEREAELNMNLWEEEYLENCRSACDVVYADVLDSAYDEAVADLEPDLDREWDELEEKWSCRQSPRLGNTAIVTITPLQDLYDESEIACGRRRPIKLIPFSRMACVVLCDSRLSVPARILYTGLQWYTDKRGRTFVGQERLAADLGWSKRKIRRYTRELREAALIDVMRRMNSSSITTLLPLASRYTSSELKCLLSDEPVVARFRQLAHEHLTESAVPQP